MSKNNNDVNVLLKIDIPKSLPNLRKQINDISKRLEKNPIKLRAELNPKMSEIRRQVTAISTAVANKPVLLKVKLDPSVKNVRTQISALTKQLSNQPVNLKVRLDTRNAAAQAKQLAAQANKSLSTIKQPVIGQKVKGDSALISQIRSENAWMTTQGKVKRDLDQQFAKSNNEANKRHVQSVSRLAAEAVSWKSMAQVQNELVKSKHSIWSDKTNAQGEAGLATLRRSVDHLKTYQNQLNLHPEIQNRVNKAIGDFNTTLSQLSTKRAGFNGQQILPVTQIEAESKKMQGLLREANQAFNSAPWGKNAQQYGDNMKRLGDLIQQRDINKIKDFVSNMEGARVKTIELRDKGLSKTGSAMTGMTATFESGGSTARKLSAEFDNATQSLSKYSNAMVHNQKANQGFFQRMGKAMVEVPLWMGAMGAFYGSLRGISSIANEIMTVDKAMTNLARVAGSHLNLDIMFNGAVDASKKLGNSIHAIMDTMGDFTRTYGDFNERQILAMTETATLMSNVSELTVEDSMKTLVGTMNAFKIEATDSIRVVDALNEVDNNYAVSTQQLAEGLKKSAGSARAYGVTMEENIGHTTAIAAVTMESGNIIGNSLKTIYSRMVTLGPAEKALNDVGVSIKQMGAAGEEVRPVADIMEELAGKWWTLSDAERQNVAVKVAGMHQQNRFLALMSNYDMAIDSTSTAMTSQGSAMRENAAYMASFEARVNQMKNSFTALALTIGDAFMTGALSGLIDLFSTLAESGTSLIGTFGVLGPLFGTIGFGLQKFGAFDGAIQRMKFSLAQTRAEMEKTRIANLNMAQQNLAYTRSTTGMNAAMAAGLSVQGQQAKALAEVNRHTQATGRFAPIAATGLNLMGTAFKGLMSATLVGAALMAVGFAIEKLIGKYQEKKEEERQIAEMQSNIVDAYRNTEDGLDGLVAKYQELNAKVSSGEIQKGTKEYDEFLAVSNKLGDAMPELVRGFDEQGNAIINSSANMEEAVGRAEQLSLAYANMSLGERAEEVKDLGKSYKDVSKDLDKAAKDVEKAKTNQEMYTQSLKDTADTNGLVITSGGAVIDYNKQLEDSISDVFEATGRQMIKQAELHMVYQEASALSANYAMANLEISGSLKNLGASSQTFVQNVTRGNTEVTQSWLESGKSMDDVIEAYTVLGTTAGTVISDYKEKLKEKTDDPLELEKIQNNFELLVAAIPPEFITDDMLNNPELLESKLGDVLSVLKDVDASTDLDGLRSALEDSGVKGEVLEGIMNNVQSSIAKGDLKTPFEEGAEAIDEMADAAREAIDPIQELFGLGNQDLSGIQSHLDKMGLLISLHGEAAAKEMPAYKQSLYDLEQGYGLAIDGTKKSIEETARWIDIMGNTKMALDENGKFVMEYSGVLEDGDQKLKDWAKSQEDLTNAIHPLTGEIFDATQGFGELSTEMLEAASAGDETSNSADNVKESLEGINQTDLGTAKSELNDLDEKLQNTETSTVSYKSALDRIKEQRSFDSTANSLDSASESGTTFESKMDVIKSQLENTGSQSTEVDKVGSSFDEAGNKADGASGQVEGFNSTISNASADAVKGIQTEIKQTGDEADVASDKVEDMGNVDISTDPVSNLSDEIGNVDTESGKAKIGLSDMVSSAMGMAIAQAQAAALVAAMDKVASAAKTAGDSITKGLSGSSKGFSSIQKGSSAAISSLNQLSTSTRQVSSLNAGLSKTLATSASSMMRVAVTARTSNGVLINTSTSTRTATTSFNNLTRAAQQLVTALGRVASISRNVVSSSRAVISAKTAEVRAFQLTSRAADTMGKAYAKLASTAISTTQRILSTIKNQQRAIDGLRNAYQRATSQINSSFSSMASSVASRTGNMIGAHNRQISAINRLASSARSAQSAINNLNSRVSSATSNMNNFINRASRASSVKAPSVSASSVSEPSTQIASFVANSQAFSSSAESSSAPVGGTSQGTSGTVSHPNSSFVGGLNAHGAFEFAALAKDSLYKQDNLGNQASQWATQTKIYETRLANINKATLQYRNMLNNIIKSEQNHLQILNRQLSSTQSRNKTIEKQVKALGATNKHSEDQRKRYNELMQEYDQNLSKINSLKTEIESTTYEIKNKGIEIFTDYVDNIIANFNKAITSIQDRVALIEFDLEMQGIVDPENINTELNLLNDKTKNLIKEQQKLAEMSSTLNKELASATKKYGGGSSQANKVRDELKEVEKAWRDVTLNIVKTEKQVKDVRAQVADDSIKLLKDYYNQSKKLITEAMDLEKKKHQESHDRQMKLYDEQIKKINTVYDNKLKAMDDDKRETEYKGKLDELNAKKAELQAKRELVARNTSIQGKKQVAALDEEIASLREEIDNTMRDRQDEILRQELEDQKNKQIELIENEKTKNEETLQSTLDKIDQEKEAIEQYYTDIIENERYWAELRDEFISGNFSNMNAEIEKMKQAMQDLDQGLFDGLEGNFSSLSSEVKKQVTELNKIIIDNLNFQVDDVIKKLDQVNKAVNQKMTNGNATGNNSSSTTNKGSSSTSTPAKTSSGSNNSSNNNSNNNGKVNASSLPLRKRKGGFATPKGGWDKHSVVDYLKSKGYWAEMNDRDKLYRALTKKSGYKGTNAQNNDLLSQLKKVVGLKSGGLTGDWVGPGGKLAVLHKKELVLNDQQTKNYLDMAKVMEKMISGTPHLTNASIPSSAQQASNQSSGDTHYHLEANFANTNSTKKEAKDFSTFMLDEIKKKGR